MKVKRADKVGSDAVGLVGTVEIAVGRSLTRPSAPQLPKTMLLRSLEEGASNYGMNVYIKTSRCDYPDPTLTS